MIKKIIAIILTLLLLVCLCGCGSDNENTDEAQNLLITTETNGTLVTTLTYDKLHAILLTKTTFNETTGIMCEYTYLYEDKGWGETVIGVNVTTTDKDGNVTNEFQQVVK